MHPLTCAVATAILVAVSGKGLLFVSYFQQCMNSEWKEPPDCRADRRILQKKKLYKKRNTNFKKSFVVNVHFFPRYLQLLHKHVFSLANRVLL